MAKSKKTKIHKKIDGQLLQMNKSFNNLKLKQKDKITAWVYEEYKKYVTENEKTRIYLLLTNAFRWENEGFEDRIHFARHV